MQWRIVIDYTYNSTGNATTAVNAINSALNAFTDIEDVATRTGSTVNFLTVVDTQTLATQVMNALTSAWAVGTRNTGRASCVVIP
jgi:hypothetical protein